MRIRKLSRRWSIVLLGVILLLFLMPHAHAALPADNAMERIVNVYENGARRWETTLRDAAWRLFWLLAIIEFTWTGVRLAFGRADLSEWIAEVTNQILFLGFFSMLLRHSTAWAKAVVNSFMSAAGQASVAAGGTQALYPSNVFDAGLQIALKLRENASVFEPIDSLGLLICAVIIVACFALITLFMILALIEAYIVISGGVLFMGFGGSRWTKDYAIKTFQYAISVGAKLFVLVLLVGLAEALFREWLGQFDATREVDIFLAIGASIVMLGLTKSIPDIVQGLINGGSFGHGSALTGAAATVGGAVTTAASNVVGAGVATGAALKLAGAQMAGAGATSTAGRYAALTGRAAQNLGKAALEDVGRRLSGRAHHGAMTWRMADSLKQQTRGLQAERDKPTESDNDRHSATRPNVIRPQTPPSANR